MKVSDFSNWRCATTGNGAKLPFPPPQSPQLRGRPSRGVVFGVKHYNLVWGSPWVCPGIPCKELSESQNSLWEFCAGRELCMAEWWEVRRKDNLQTGRRQNPETLPLTSFDPRVLQFVATQLWYFWQDTTGPHWDWYSPEEKGARITYPDVPQRQLEHQL